MSDHAKSNGQQRRRDHDLLLQCYRLAERQVELMESFSSPDAEEKRELLRTIARTGALDRILKPQ